MGVFVNVVLDSDMDNALIWLNDKLTLIDVDTLSGNVSPR